MHHLTIILILYVDDGLRNEFEITVSKPGHFVGMEILDETDENNDRCIFIHQSNYIRRMTKKFHMQDVVSIPADPRVRVEKPEEDWRSNGIFPFCEAVGSLMFAAIVTRPDIMFATNQVSRYTSNHDMSGMRSNIF